MLIVKCSCTGLPSECDSCSMRQTIANAETGHKGNEHYIFSDIIIHKLSLSPCLSLSHTHSFSLFSLSLSRTLSPSYPLSHSLFLSLFPLYLPLSYFVFTPLPLPSNYLCHLLFLSLVPLFFSLPSLSFSFISVSNTLTIYILSPFFSFFM